MRNLKRALSLALASVMLLGMMVVGSSAAFADADEIVNKEAVEITAGLGLFAGSDGKFNPTGTVTRAQMAAVIAKMFYGSDLNADTYKGGNKFSDTAAFEGGWAEGYVNLGVEKGWFKGYGDGTFGPGNAVTTAEAVTMLINLLKVDAGEGTWPMTVMAAAEEIDLFDLDIELKPAPATNVALTRDQLAVMVWNALNYSAEGKNVYMVGDKKFDTAADAHYYAQSLTPAGTIAVMPAEDALVTATFGLKTETGFVISNQATGAECTTIETIEGDTIDVALETGLDMIGHFVTVYYETEWTQKEPGTAYCIFDEAEYVVVEKEIEEDRKAFNAAFGSKQLTANADVQAATNHEYDVAVGAEIDYDYDYTNKSAGKGTYIVYEGKFVGFITPATKTVVEIGKISTKAGNESITILGGERLMNTEDNDQVVEYEGIATEDIAIMVTAQDVKYLTKADQMTGEVTKTGKDADENDIITVDGKTYGFADYVDAATIADVEFNYTYVFFMDGDKIVAVEELEGNVDMGNIVYVVGAYETTADDAYGNAVTSAYAQVVDMEGKESALLIGIDYETNTTALKDMGVYFDGNNDATFNAEAYATGFAVYEVSKLDSNEKKAGIMVVDEDAIATEPEAEKATLFADTVTDEFNSKTTTVDTDTDGLLAFLSENTKFILVDGAAGKTLDVSIKTGLVNLESDTYDVLLTSDKSGIVTLEVVVFVEDEMTLPSADLIYVSEAQIAGIENVADAFEVEVYFLATNEFKTITVADTVELVDAGFYSYTYDAAEDLYVELDGDDPANLREGEILQNVNGTKLITTTIRGLDAAEAVIIDTRSAKELEKSDFAEVEDLADLKALVASDIEVTMDVVLDEDLGEEVIAIFILSVEEIEEEPETPAEPVE